MAEAGLSAESVGGDAAAAAEAEPIIASSQSLSLLLPMALVSALFSDEIPRPSCISASGARSKFAATEADVFTASVSVMVRGGRAAADSAPAATAGKASRASWSSCGDVLIAGFFLMNLFRLCTWCLSNFFCNAAAKRLSSSPSLESQSLLLCSCTDRTPSFLETTLPAALIPPLL